MAKCVGQAGELASAAVRAERTAGQDGLHGRLAEYVGGERRAACAFISQLSLLPFRFFSGSSCYPSLFFTVDSVAVFHGDSSRSFAWLGLILLDASCTYPSQNSTSIDVLHYDTTILPNVLSRAYGHTSSICLPQFNVHWMERNPYSPTGFQCV